MTKTIGASTDMADVPCNGCTLCCHGDAIRILPGDDVNRYKTVPHDWLTGQLMLDHKPNGDCIYLGDGGCTIHETKPRMCREMDCRAVANSLTYTQARVNRILPVWERGKRLTRATSTASSPSAEISFANSTTHQLKDPDHALPRPQEWNAGQSIARAYEGANGDATTNAPEQTDGLPFL